MAHKRTEIISRGVLIYDDRILLCRNRKRGHSFLPGGHVEFAEPASAALAREVREELGIDLIVGDFLGAMEASFIQAKGHRQSFGGDSDVSPPKGRRHHEINLIFSLSPIITDGDFDPASLRSCEKHIEFVWVPICELTGDASELSVLPQGILAVVATAWAKDVTPAKDAWKSSCQ